MKLYSDHAQWFHLLTAPEEYQEEAGVYQQALLEIAPGAKTLLELGSGGGNNASWLKSRFEMTLVDLSPQMLAISRTLNPELEHIQGDMRSLRLNRQFDAVFIHDAIGYMSCKEDLLKALVTAALHCRPGGAALFCPDYVKETFVSQTGHGGHDGHRGVGLRYLEWNVDSNPDDEQYVVDFAYLMRDMHGTVTIDYDQHVMGLFSQADWLDLIRQAGFEPGIAPFNHSDAPIGSINFTGKRI